MTKKLTDAEKTARKRARLRDKYRETVCAGCRHNRYNYQSDGDGWNAPTSGCGCWHLESVERGKCSFYFNYSHYR